MNEQKPLETFETLGVAPKIIEVLKAANITAPTPIQHSAIPVALEGKDLIGIAQTGTGKTFAFGLPMLQRLMDGHAKRALILVPTRELAQQVEESLRKVAQSTGMFAAVFVGGASMNMQRQMIRRNPRILIATPGRLIDHLEQKTVTLREVSILVLDEADRMLDMGFAPQIKKILKEVPTERQTLLFSATMPKEIVQIATHHMKTPLRVEVAPQGTAAERVEQAVLILHREDKPTVLLKLLTDYTGTVLVFMRTKHNAKKLTKFLIDSGHKAAEIHSNRSLSQRKEALHGFKTGRYRVLVATDIAARGIDVKDIELVVNYDLPDNPEEYVHRIGRTGRAGKPGQALSLATSDQRQDIKIIERLMRMTLPVSDMRAPGQRTEARDDRPRPALPRFKQRRPPLRRGGFKRGGPRR